MHAPVIAPVVVSIVLVVAFAATGHRRRRR